MDSDCLAGPSVTYQCNFERHGFKPRQWHLFYLGAPHAHRSAFSCRYEIGRFSAKKWQTWNDNLRRIAANPRNIVAANNMYDLEYIK